MTAQQTALSGDAMIGYWTSFAKTGKPVAAGAPDWPLLWIGGRLHEHHRRAASGRRESDAGDV